MNNKKGAKEAKGWRLKLSAFVKNNKLLFSLCITAAIIALAAIIYVAVIFLTKDRPFSYSEPQMPLTEVFGDLFGINTELSSRPEASDAESSNAEDMKIPFDQTKLSHAFDMLDKRYLYIEGTSYTSSDNGYIKVKRVYGVKDDSIYIMLDNGVEDYHLISDGTQVVGLDFEKSTYTVTSPIPYSIDELLFTGGYETCAFEGTDTFMGVQKPYEEYTIYSTSGRREWIRYYFNEDNSLAGYERYINNELNEIMAYDYLGSDFPEDAVVYFEIPAGFEKEDIYIDWSDIFGDE